MKLQEIYDNFKHSFASHLTLKPVINYYEDGNEAVVEIEYITSKKRLTLFIDQNRNFEYLKSWGYRIFQDMESGELNSNAQLQELYKWLDTP